MSLRSLATRALALCGIAALAACDVSYPVTVLGPNGTAFRGYASNTFLRGGSFYATNGGVQCTGRYTQHSDIRTVSFPVQCSNGLNGIGTAAFDSPASGSGLVRMSDGSQWQFIFGRQALSL